MSENSANDSLLEMFLYETEQNTEQLEQIILDTEQAGAFNEQSINEIFRIMHTIKGSAAMMSYTNISAIAHKLEDLFYYIRENPDAKYSCSDISDLVLACMDYISKETERIREGKGAGEEDSAGLAGKIESALETIKAGSRPISGERETEAVRKYRAHIFFEQGCEMENIRAYSVVLNLGEIARSVAFEPADITDNEDTAKQIRAKGFVVHIETEKSYDEVLGVLKQTTFLRELELKEEKEQASEARPEGGEEKLSADKESKGERPTREYHQQPPSMISVNVAKLDKLMDLMGEIVIAESMVVENPELEGCNLPSFRKAAVHLRKMLGEMQNMVMSLRLVPLAATFQKMHRIVRDMSRKLGKDVRLQLAGEDTDVDKNIIEHISDPLIHLVRNSIDHGIESPQERVAAGKPPYGTLTLEAQNAGSDVMVTIGDDGRGLNKEKILKKARANGLIRKPESELSDKEIYNMIFLPGFSTSDKVSEFSGRGVGMDVVTRNITAIGGSVSVDSAEGKGMTVTLKIPLTVAIIDGMNIGVGDARFTIPITAIRESFKPRREDIFKDTDGNEMIMVRGECLAILRLHKQWDIPAKAREPEEGILVLIEQEEKKRCVFADTLIGRQQVVVKSLPQYIKETRKIDYLSGCTLLGDGSISLILDVGWLAGADIK